jgi:head-tail adaptor
MIGYNKSEIVGKMRERVILQNRIITQSDSGFQSEIYSDIGIYWSKIEYKTGFEEEDADKLSNQQKINITLRYNILVNVNSRFVYRNELYQVEKVEYSDDRRFMICVCVWRSSYTSIYAGSIFCSASLLAQSSLSAALMRVIKYQASLNAFGSVSADINFVQKVASSLNANGLLSGDISFVQKAQASLLTSANVNASALISKLPQASLLATGTTTADLTVQAAASLLLDLYPNAAAAYSLRKLRTAYTGSAVRVRASISGAEGDVSFDVNSTISASSTVTVTAVGTSGLSIGQQVTFSTFWNAGGSNQNVFVTTWYDQSGSARNATQTTQASQPSIVNSGFINFINLKPGINFVGGSTVLMNFNQITLSNFTILWVSRKTPLNQTAIILSGGLGSPSYAGDDVDNAGCPNLYAGAQSVIVKSLNNTTSELTGRLSQHLCYLNRRNTNQAVGQFNNSNNSYNNVVSANNFVAAGIANYGSNYNYAGDLQEIIIYSSDKSDERTNISNNINIHYGIY